jgi:hypothetical protein
LPFPTSCTLRIHWSSNDLLLQPKKPTQAETQPKPSPKNRPTPPKPNRNQPQPVVGKEAAAYNTKTTQKPPQKRPNPARNMSSNDVLRFQRNQIIQIILLQAASAPLLVIADVKLY